MFQLPKGNPLFENLAVTKLKLTDVVTKLANGSFSGYASFTFPGATGILVFEAGKLITTFYKTTQGQPLSDFEAMTALAEQMANSGTGTMDVYRLSKDLTMCVNSLLQGEVLYRSQELVLIDIKNLLERIKNERMNGCLRIYTDEKSAMIFYKEGNPLGFFHDGSQDIDSSPGESHQLAQDPKAKLDLYTSVSADELMAHDLLDVINVAKIWDAAVARKQAELERMNRELAEKDRMLSLNLLNDLENQIRNVYVEYVGTVGRGIIDKELTTAGGNTCLQDPERSEQFLAALEKAAKLLINVKKITEMKEKINALLTQARA
ncbi:MAG: GTPase-activating protein [Geobacter sp.]